MLTKAAITFGHGRIHPGSGFGLFILKFVTVVFCLDMCSSLCPGPVKTTVVGFFCCFGVFSTLLYIISFLMGKLRWMHLWTNILSLPVGMLRPQVPHNNKQKCPTRLFRRVQKSLIARLPESESCNKISVAGVSAFLPGASPQPSAVRNYSCMMILS
jgi:hypothetical protein